MKKLCFLPLIVFLACSPDKKKQDTQADKSADTVTIVFRSAETDQLLVHPAITLKETETLESSYQMNPGDTLTLQLNAALQTVSLDYQFVWSLEFIVSPGDTIVAEIETQQKNVYRLVNGKRQAIKSVEEEAYCDTSAIQAQKRQMEKSLKLKTTQPAAALKAFTSANEAYFGRKRDSLLRIGSPRARLLADVVLADQYGHLMDFNAEFKDAGLEQTLVSDKYLNRQNFNNRHLTPIFNAYQYHYIIRNAMDKPLVEQYKSAFTGFPEEIEATFKLNTIIQMILNKYDRKTLIAYIDDYKHVFGSNQTLEYWMKEIDYGTPVSNDLYLTDTQNSRTTWKDLLKQWRGKVVYVDFWASWCGPCIGEMPYSKKLKSELKDVEFVYLALNDEEQPWEKALDKYEITEKSYLITNSKTSAFITDHRINSIPRYMIINKKGEIVNADAPRPSSKEISYLLKAELRR